MLLLSGSDSDAEFSRALAGDLTAAGFDVRTASNGKFESDAVRAASSLIVVLSPDSIASQAVNNAVAIAVDQQTPIIPIVARATTIPKAYRPYDPVDAETAGGAVVAFPPRQATTSPKLLPVRNSSRRQA